MIRSETKIAQSILMTGEGPTSFDAGITANFEGNSGKLNTLLFLLNDELYAASQDDTAAKWHVERIQIYSHAAGVCIARNTDAVAGLHVKVANLEDDLNRLELSDVIYDKSRSAFTVANAGALNISKNYRAPQKLEDFHFNQNVDLPVYFVQFRQGTGDSSNQHAWLARKKTTGDDPNVETLALIWDNFSYEPKVGLICFPVSTMPMGKQLRGAYTFVSTEERSNSWQQPGILFYTINQDTHSDWLWHCFVQRQYVTQRLTMSFSAMNYCFAGTAYPALQLFAIDKEKGQIHWLEQTDGVMGGNYEDLNIDGNYGPRPIFAPWHCIVTVKHGEEPTVFRAVAPLTIGADEVMLFAVDKYARLWALRRELTNAQVWNGTMVSHDSKPLLVKKLANDQFAQLVPGATPDGRPQVFFSGNTEGGPDAIWRVYLNNEIWSAEVIVNG